MLHVTDHIQIPDTEFEFTFARSGGPGGQNVNKVNSKAVMHWNVEVTETLPPGIRQRFFSKYANRISKDGMLVLHSQRYRDQGRNVTDCLKRLSEMIRSVVAPPIKRRPTKPSRGAQQRRLQGKKEKSDKKQSRQKPSFGD